MLPDDQLERQLSAAGDRARADRGAAPDAAYAASLRDGLLAAYAPQPTPAPEPRRPWFAIPRLMRVAPMALAAVLAVATVVGAQQLLVALAPDPSTTPTPMPSVALSTVQPSPTATPQATVVPVQSAEPAATPSTTPSATPKPTPQPTPEPTAKPTPPPTPKPTPKPIGSMSLNAFGCHGGVVLDWSPYGDERFNHYTTLRNTVASIPKAYPPQGGAVDFGTSYTQWVEKTSAVDAGGTPGTTYYYRTMAFDSEDRVIATSPVRSAIPKAIKPLGALNVAAEGADTRLSWTPYGGSPACFTYYKIVYSETNPEPSYGTDPHLAALGGQSEGTWLTTSEYLESGKTYHLRVQAIRATDLGWFVAAQSTVATYSVP